MITKLTRQQMKDRLDSAEGVIVEVSSGETYMRAHLPGAIQFDLPEIAGDFESNVRDKTQLIILYSIDRGSPDATRAAHQLEAMGYHTLEVYDEGKDEWIAAGLPMETFYSPVDAHEMFVTDLTNVEKSRYLNNTSKAKLPARTDVGYKDIA